MQISDQICTVCVHQKAIRGPHRANLLKDSPCVDRADHIILLVESQHVNRQCASFWCETRIPLQFGCLNFDRCILGVQTYASTLREWTYTSGVWTYAALWSSDFVICMSEVTSCVTELTGWSPHIKFGIAFRISSDSKGLLPIPDKHSERTTPRPASQTITPNVITQNCQRSLLHSRIDGPISEHEKMYQQK